MRYYKIYLLTQAVQYLPNLGLKLKQLFHYDTLCNEQ